MKAIRPIYDGMDDLDERDWIDYIDMMVCLFSQIHEGIDSMEDLDEEQKEELRNKVDLEILPTGVISTDSDQAGANAAARDAETIAAAGGNPYIIQMGNSKDPAEFIETHDKGAFIRLVDDTMKKI